MARVAAVNSTQIILLVFLVCFSNSINLINYMFSQLKADLKAAAKLQSEFTAQATFLKYVSNDPADLQLVESLRNPKTSVCGKRIE